MVSSIVARSALALFSAALLAHITVVNARPLNDTGETRCSDGTNYVSCSSVQVTHPGQDARYGRDVAAGTSALPAKVGFGGGGFDFTKIGNNGAAVAPTASAGILPGQYACIKDNVTGLLWYAGFANGLAWRDPNPTTNGGNAGAAATSPNTASRINDANVAEYCGKSNWRLPKVREMLSVFSLGPGTGGGCGGDFADQAFNVWFKSAYYWTSQTSPVDSSRVFVVFLPGTSFFPPGICGVYEAHDKGAISGGTYTTLIVSD
jgi:Protein of unknown function (DUF1566)